MRFRNCGWLLLIGLCAACGPRVLAALPVEANADVTPEQSPAPRAPLPTWTPPVTRLPATATATPTRTVSPTRTFTPSPTALFACADLDGAWAVSDWPRALVVLAALESANATCGAESLSEKRYAAHINYAVMLEHQNQKPAAIDQYRAALSANGRGAEALAALIRLNALPDPTAPPCEPGELAPYTPVSEENFVRAEAGQLWDGAEPLVLRGANYYPRHAAWDKFLTGSDPEEMSAELDVMAAAGFNTLRVFLWYDPLFTCAPESATPNPQTFARWEAFIAEAHARGLRLLVTLNDLPDLLFRPLYTDWPRYDAQTAFIVQRYQNEPTIIGWDLRNEGDLDYDDFGRRPVLDWLTHASAVVRANDSRHWLTAGWFSNPIDTAANVDVLSFHHWKTAADLTQRIQTFRMFSDKPLILEEVGYPSAGRWDEAAQAKRLDEVLGAAEQAGLAGWLAWAAFDFPPSAPHSGNPEYYYGLWRLDLSPKPALEALPLP